MFYLLNERLLLGCPFARWPLAPRPLTCWGSLNLDGFLATLVREGVFELVSTIGGGHVGYSGLVVMPNQLDRPHLALCLHLLPARVSFCSFPVGVFDKAAHLQHSHMSDEDF